MPRQRACCFTSDLSPPVGTETQSKIKGEHREEQMFVRNSVQDLMGKIRLVVQTRAEAVTQSRPCFQIDRSYNRHLVFNQVKFSPFDAVE